MKASAPIPFRIAHGKNASQSTGLSWAVITVGFILMISIPHPALASGCTTANQGWSVSSSTWNSVSAFVKLSRKKTALETSILDIVGKAEAPLKGYDSVVLSARIQPKKSPSKMTLAEIQVWVRNSPNQNHAIGRYQFIPETFDRVVRVLKLLPNRAMQLTPAPTRYSISRHEHYPANMIDLMDMFPTEESCLEYLSLIRRPDVYHCLKCGSVSYWKKSRGIFYGSVYKLTPCQPIHIGPVRT